MTRDIVRDEPQPGNDSTTTATSVSLHDGRSLFFRASGPGRENATTPVVIIEHGLGGSSLEWVAAERLISRFARVICYERSGYWPSDLPSHEQPAIPAGTAKDLKELLEVAGIRPPFVLVGHSHGGVLIRQCLADWPTGWVSGMVIVDSAPTRNAIPDSWTELLGGDSYYDVVGLESNRVLSDKEWAAVQDMEVRNAAITAREAEYLDHHAAELRFRLAEMHQPLGKAPLSVICCQEAEDMKRVYEHGLANGHGSREAREAMRKRLEDMAELDESGMKEHLSLTQEGMGRFVLAEGKQRTHNVVMVDPDFVAREVEWVYRRASTVR